MAKREMEAKLSKNLLIFIVVINVIVVIVCIVFGYLCVRKRRRAVGITSWPSFREILGFLTTSSIEYEAFDSAHLQEPSQAHPSPRPRKRRIRSVDQTRGRTSSTVTHSPSQNSHNTMMSHSQSETSSPIHLQQPVEHEQFHNKSDDMNVHRSIHPTQFPPAHTRPERTQSYESIAPSLRKGRIHSVGSLYSRHVVRQLDVSFSDGEVPHASEKPPIQRSVRTTSATNFQSNLQSTSGLHANPPPPIRTHSYSNVPSMQNSSPLAHDSEDENNQPLTPHQDTSNTQINHQDLTVSLPPTSPQPNGNSETPLTPAVLGGSQTGSSTLFT